MTAHRRFRHLRTLVALLALGAAACKTTAGATKTLSDAPGGLGSAGAGSLSSTHVAQYSRYLKDTVASLEQMRGRTGLIKDSIWVCSDTDLGRPNFKNTEQLTSPTNIGLDIILLTQRALADDPQDAEAARATLTKLFKTLDSVAYHESNGLYFRTYWPDTGAPEDINLSSVDNLHLAYGFWVAAGRLKTALPAVADVARRLFERMDFSDYYNPKTGLIGGNMRPIGEDVVRKVKGDPQGPYVRDLFDYKYFGSEARSLYALGWALGLYRRASQEYKDFDQRILGPAIAGTIAEIATVPAAGGGTLRLLRTWDGGGFQALLPAVLVREDLYSPIMAELHHNYAKRLLDAVATDGVPAAHSASAFGVLGLRIFHSDDKAFDDNLPIYNGAAGHIDMVASIHKDVSDPVARQYWDIAYTPHPAFMAASFARDPASAAGFADAFAQNEQLASPAACVCGQTAGASAPVLPAPRCECGSERDLPNNPPDKSGVVGEPNLCSVASATAAPATGAQDHLYQPGWGWMDGYYTAGPFKGRVVPVMISLDQSMIALALFSMLSPDGHHVGSKAVFEDAQVSARLRLAYRAINDKLAALP